VCARQVERVVSKRDVTRPVKFGLSMTDLDGAWRAPEPTVFQCQQWDLCERRRDDPACMHYNGSKRLHWLTSLQCTIRYRRNDNRLRPKFDPQDHQKTSYVRRVVISDYCSIRACLMPPSLSTGWPKKLAHFLLYGSAKIARPDIARLDNVAPDQTVVSEH